MIQEKEGDLLKAFEDGEVNCLCHCANVSNVMGAGIAKLISKRWPQALEADIKSGKGPNKIGTFSIAKVDEFRVIVNIYGQLGIGCPKNDPLQRNARYDAVFDSLYKLKIRIDNSDFPAVIGFPYGMAANLAGGKWSIVREIIYTIFDDSDISVIIYKLPGALELD